MTETATQTTAGPPHAAGNSSDRGRAIVVGASSGQGAAIVRQLAGEGYSVAAIAPWKEQLDEVAASCQEVAAAGGGRVLTYVHDVKDHAEVPELFERIVTELGGLDLMVYTAGIMPRITEDDYDTALDLEIMAVNTSGCIAWGNPCAEYLRAQRSGTIVGISSVAGDRGRRGNPAYCTSKAAMNTYLESLRNRLGQYGVHVCTIKPGYVATAMTEGLSGLFWVISPEESARQILNAARKRANVRYVPYRWITIMTIIRMMPSVIFRRLSI
jgi:NAD(P)-dependent dehydrogenase (short-subunit alcohol dehydrogenase family)